MKEGCRNEGASITYTVNVEVTPDRVEFLESSAEGAYSCQRVENSRFACGPIDAEQDLRATDGVVLRHRTRAEGQYLSETAFEQEFVTETTCEGASCAAFAEKNGLSFPFSCHKEGSGSLFESGPPDREALMRERCRLAGESRAASVR